MFHRLRAVLSAIIGVAALAWLLYSVGPLRQLVVDPMLALLQTSVRLYQLVPSWLVWLAFIVAAYLLVFSSWMRDVGDWLTHRSRPGATSGAGRAEGRVAEVARWVGRRQRGPYSRHYLKNIVSEVAVEQLAQARRLTVAQVRSALETNALGLRPEINAYLLAGLSPWPLEPVSGLREWAASLGLARPAVPPDTETEAVIEFLEDQLNSPRA